MNTDPISDMLTRIKNGYMARKNSVEIPFSQFKQDLLQFLSTHGYIGEYKKADNGKSLLVNLIYQNDEPAITEIKRLSKPGLRKYIKSKDLAKIHQGLGHVIISTPKGLKSHLEARKLSLGGELICSLW